MADQQTPQEPTPGSYAAPAPQTDSAPQAKTAELPKPLDIKKRWDAGVTRRRVVDKEAWTNAAFLAGDHYAQYDPITKKFQRPSGEDGKVRLKINHIKSLWRTEVATLVESKPVPEVVPATDGDEDIAIAETADRILEAEMDRVDIDAIRHEVVNWFTTAGLAYVHPYWEPDSKNICVEVVPHFEVVVDPAVRNNTREAHWLIHGRVLTKEEAFERYGKEYKTEDHVVPFSWSQLFGDQNNTIKSTTTNGVLVLRMWQLPSRKYPQGFVRTVIGDEVVEDYPAFPYAHKELPFIDFHHIRLPGRYEGQSALTDLIPLQKDYNAARSRQAETRSLFSGGKLMAPEGSLDIDRLTTTPGEIVTYRPVGPYRPEAMQLPQPPQYLFQDANQTLAEMEDISGQHEVSRGQAPSGMPASAIIALQEKDERRVATTIRSLERGLARTGKQVLMLVKQYWNTQRTIRCWSEKTGEMGVYLFKGADLTDGWDVRVVPGSALPKSKSQARVNALALWRERVITDPKMILQMMELPNGSSVLKVLSVDMRQAKREHDRIFEGQQVIAETWHNHDVHIHEHNDFRKTEIFEGWQVEARGALADHVQQHMDVQKQMAQQALYDQAAAQGQVIPPGGLTPVGSMNSDGSGFTPAPGGAGGDISGIPGVNAALEQSGVPQSAISNVLHRAEAANPPQG